ncbi:MAG: hypothetical protein ACQEP9_07695 [Bacillota bacterium]
MLKKSNLIFIMLVATSLLLSGCFGGSDLANVTLQIQDETGEKIEADKIIVSNDEYEETFTNKSVLQESIPTGKYSIAIEADGYENLEEQEVNISEEEILKFDLVKQPSLTLEVSDEDGEELVADKIMISNDDYQQVFEEQSGVTEKLSKGDYNVTIEAEGYDNVSEQKVNLDQDKNLTFNLEKKPGINLKIRDEDGNKVVADKIVISNDDYQKVFEEQSVVEEILPTGEYEIDIEAEGYENILSKRVVVDKYKFLETNLENKPTMVLNLKDEDGNKVVADKIMISNDDYQQVFEEESVVEEQLSKAEYMIDIEITGYGNVSSKKVELNENKVLDIVLEEKPAITIEVKKKDGNNLVADEIVISNDEHKEVIEGKEKATKHLFKGDYNITIRAAGYHELSDAQLNVEKDKEVNFVLEKSRKKNENYDVIVENISFEKYTKFLDELKELKEIKDVYFKGFNDDKLNVVITTDNLLGPNRITDIILRETSFDFATKSVNQLEIILVN